MTALVKDHGDMGGGVWAGIAFNIALQHVAKPADRADRQTIGFACQRGQRVKGAKDEGRTVDEVQVAPFSELRV